jgi:CDP-diacylglycerol--serine O-phosphatidyltransferase
LFESWFSHGLFSIIVATSGLSLAALNVSQIKTPKLSGRPFNVFLLVAYTLGVTFIYGGRLL